MLYSVDILNKNVCVSYEWIVFSINWHQSIDTFVEIAAEVVTFNSVDIGKKNVCVSYECIFSLHKLTSADHPSFSKWIIHLLPQRQSRRAVYFRRNTIRDGDSTALYTVDTVCTVYTNQTDVLCLNSSMYASMQLGKVRTLLEWADGLLSKMLDGWWMDGWYHLDCFMTTRPPMVLKNPGVSWMLTILSISQWIAPPIDPLLIELFSSSAQISLNKVFTSVSNSQAQNF